MPRQDKEVGGEQWEQGERLAEGSGQLVVGVLYPGNEKGYSGCACHIGLCFHYTLAIKQFQRKFSKLAATEKATRTNRIYASGALTHTHAAHTQQSYYAVIHML